ncbi:DUF294 nucleotidyltransferase-like domain-containing protein [bacterium]|nr:DUF294 nucleotidyltransferase-like domain-containing protein [bacterium]
MSRPYAANREPVYDTLVDQAQRHQLKSSWKNSADAHTTMRSALLAAQLPDDVLTVVVSGSMGRMEVVVGSDCDLIVILSDSAIADAEVAADCYSQVATAIQPAGLATSKPGGVFSTPNSFSRICDQVTLGIIDEDMTTFGQRIQLLIDSQPIYGDQQCARLQSAILARYAYQTIEYDASKQWTYLLNELIRYHRSLCVRTQWQTRNTPTKWRTLNLKLAHSRMVNYAGLLLLLGECSTQKRDKQQWLFDRLALTPLERVCHVLNNHGHDPTAVVDCYNRFLSSMNDTAFLESLADGPDTGQPDDHPGYCELRTSARAITTTLANFLLDRPAGWDEQFIQLMLL